jgi:hypothetical protein
MGLDGTIRRPDGKPLGEVAEVRAALAVAFPGIVFGRLPSGAEKIQAAAEQGVTFPEIIRQHLERAPAEHGGDYKGPDFKAAFFLGSSEIVHEVGVQLYGTTVASEPMFALLEQRFGWVTTHP